MAPLIGYSILYAVTLIILPPLTYAGWGLLFRLPGVMIISFISVYKMVHAWWNCPPVPWREFWISYVFFIFSSLLTVDGGDGSQYFGFNTLLNHLGVWKGWGSGSLPAMPLQQNSNWSLVGMLLWLAYLFYNHQVSKMAPRFH